MDAPQSPPQTAATHPPVKAAHQPFHILAKPIGPLCNLGCSYCFYLEKEKLFPANENFKMRPDTLEAFVRSYIEAQPGNEVSFAWQGGEPTLMGVDFFRMAVAFQKKHANGKSIGNAFQTNGTLLDDEWGEFLAQNEFLVGISIDGPEALHNLWRVDKKQKPTFAKVMQGIELLQKHKVEFNTLTCVHRQNAKKPLDVYRFLRGIGSRHLQFIPIIERPPNERAKDHQLWLAAPPADSAVAEPESRVTPWSVIPKDYGTFLSTIFDRWVHNDVGRVFVQDFDVALANWLGMPPGLCIHSETCGRALALEHDGSVYACDHYVYPEYKLGNLKDTPLEQLADSDAMRRFGNAKRDTLPLQCKECPVRFACHGGCPKHRFLQTKSGDPGLNYLCEGYYHFYTHIDPYMRTLARLYRAQRPSSVIMDLLKQEAISP
ncbi:MAG: anaerobic sulfatase maturase [Verrucomicrobiota bacterium]|nr:anaerobic sulfatase maturase [Verrucomicrobiota bacterium]